MKALNPEVIQKIRGKLAEQTKEKKEYASHFKNGGTVADFKPKYQHVYRTI